MPQPTPTSHTRALAWFRRDLRADDHAALHHALASADRVYAAFVFDPGLLDPLPRRDRRVEFIRESLVQLDATLRARGGGLIVLHERPEVAIPRLASRLGVQAVFAGKDYEPGAIARDAAVRDRLAQDGVALHLMRDHVIFEGAELLTQGGRAYSVFTPYKRAWLARLAPSRLEPLATQGLRGRLAPPPEDLGPGVPALAALGFEATDLRRHGFGVGASGAQALLEDFLGRIDAYDRTRDFPALPGTSRLSVHLRFGTVSIRQLVALAHRHAQTGSEGAATWLSELVWRDFYFQVLANFPHVADARGDGGNFRPEFDRVTWESGAQAEERFAAWCEGRTGYPLVDAAMRQLNTTGYMHNRLRMVTASFLTKHLGIDWRRGERYFARALNDYDLAANNGGWQWAASTGCDAQPWFRIFNPVTQSERFDAGGEFIVRFLPQLATLPAPLRHAPWTASPLELQAAGLRLGEDYPLPIVDHAQAREATLRRFGVVKSGGQG